ncbi:MAG: putative DNA binding domain-containing protein [Burkholderiaceae bacterium]|nr:putative DNA binding domain-containing protein [Burkholderiaceae bacterium]
MADTSMTAKEMQVWLRARFPTEDERHEWKEWVSLKSNISGRKGEDLVSYVSALSNMNGGCIVIGVQDKTLAVTGIQDLADYTPENIVHRVLGKTPGLPSVGLHVEVLQTSDTGAIVWLVHVPRHAPRQPVQAHDKAWQRDGDSLVELRPDRLRGILTELIAGQDWSAEIVPGATVADLDPAAIAKAREKFAAKHQQERWAAEITDWSTEEFLDKAKITRHGRITRTALLLLGTPQSVGLLPHSTAEITWKVPDERIAKHFGPPFLLTTTEVAQHIRNPNIKLFPATELLAIELPRYDIKVILEGLHNCLAHQDYEQAGRIVVLETVGRLRLSNLGGFVDGKPEDYFTGERTPSVYRNPWLAVAMNNIGMIDKGGYGIRDMVTSQRKRYLPLPDYEGSTPTETLFNIYGQQIDENYSRMLMERSDLPLEQVIWLDRVQKKLKIANDQATLLRRAQLIEGRKPNFFVSAVVAKVTNTQNQYVLNKGFDDDHYKRTILKRLKLGPATGDQLRQLVLDKLPAVLSAKEKETKVKNLRTALRLRGLEGVFIEVAPSGPSRGAGAIWRIKA